MHAIGLRDKLIEQVRASKISAKTIEAQNAVKPPWRVTVRRVIAFLLDCLLIHAVGLAIVFLAGEKLYFIGDGGWWLGLCIASLYFAIFDSWLFAGRTLGKSLLGIEVRKVDGLYINPFLALLRFVPFAAIFVIYSITKNADPYSPFVNVLLLIATLIFLTIAVFGIFHPRHRSIHDLMSCSVVVRAGEDFLLSDVRIKKTMVIFLISTAIVLGVQGTVCWQRSMSPESKKISHLWRILDARKDIQNPRIGVFHNLERICVPSKNFFISVYVPKTKVIQFHDYEVVLARKLKNYILSTKVIPVEAEQIVVEVRSGYDIGIGGKDEKSTHTFLRTNHFQPLL